MPQSPPAVPEGWINPGQCAGGAESGPYPGQDESGAHNKGSFFRACRQNHLFKLKDLMDLLQNNNKNDYMQHKQDDFPKDGQKNWIKGPDHTKNNDKDDNFGQDEAMA